MAKKPTTITEYLASLPDDRRKVIEAVRKTIKKNLPKGYAEGIQYGMIGYFVPHSIYPDGYHCDPSQPLPFASLASQKNHMAIYLMCIYSDEAQKDRFVKAWKATGKKLDMGKSCVRFKKLEDVPLDVVGEAIKRVPVKAYIEQYESVYKSSSSKRPTKKTTKKSATKKAASKKTTKKATKKGAKKSSKKKVTKKTTKRPR